MMTMGCVFPAFLHDHSRWINLSEALRGKTVLVAGLFFCWKARSRKHYYDSSYRITFVSFWLESDEIFATAPFFLCQLNPRGSLCAWQAEGKIKRIIGRMMNWTVGILGEKLQTHINKARSSPRTLHRTLSPWISFWNRFAFTPSLPIS